MTPTPQQQNFYNTLLQTKDSILLQAVAGSGKTTSLVEAINQLMATGYKGKTLAVAFNRDIKQNLERKMPLGVTCLTLNGLGHKALTSMLGNRPIPDARRTTTILKQLAEELNIGYLKDDFFAVPNLVSVAKMAGLVPTEAPSRGRTQVPNTIAHWQWLADSYDIEVGPKTIQLAKSVLLRSIDLTLRTGECDFDDQLYIPICFQGFFPKFDLVIVDEAQDLNPIQHQMLHKCLSRKGRLIAVGDPAQAIYGFRGALHDSMEQIQAIFDTTQLPLTKSFRCAKAIVHEAQKVYSHIEAFDDNPAGTVTKPKTWCASDIEPNSAIICRNNAPLLTTAYRLLANGVKVSMRGNDFGRSLKQLVKKIANGKPTTSVEAFQDLLETWLDNRLKEAKVKDRHGLAARAHDKAASIQVIINGDNCTTVEGITKSIDKIFSKAQASVELSTGHRAKGDEWSTVYFLDHTLLPSRYARGTAALIQEDNLKYVIITRAINKLVYINSDDYRGT